MIKELFLELLFIVFPILLYQFLILIHVSSGWRCQIGLGLFCGLAMNSSVLLQGLLAADFSRDFIYVPLIISLLYGGFASLGIAMLFFFLLCGMPLGVVNGMRPWLLFSSSSVSSRWYGQDS